MLHVMLSHDLLLLVLCRIVAIMITDSQNCERNLLKTKEILKKRKTNCETGFFNFLRFIAFTNFVTFRSFFVRT